MNKVIFFTDTSKLSEAFNYFPISDFKNKRFALKLHMGEPGNKYFPKPETIQKVINFFKTLPSTPYLFDTTVGYSGLRHTIQGYQKVAKRHGFASLGCDVVIDDTGIPVTIENKSYDVAEHLHKSTHIVAFSHVKGHVATGMGGAIKNFGMGGVTKETKLSMHHGARPLFEKDKCTYCGVCAEVCPFEAITVTQDSWKQDMEKCFGCGVCVDQCKSEGISYKHADFQYVLACAAKACVQNKKVLYINDVNRIANSCDCDPDAGPVIAPDIGYLVSDDPVAIDKASVDLIHDVKPDIFEQVNYINPLNQINYGEQIGLGSSQYQLIDL